MAKLEVTHLPGRMGFYCQPVEVTVDSIDGFGMGETVDHLLEHGGQVKPAACMVTGYRPDGGGRYIVNLLPMGRVLTTGEHATRWTIT